MNRHEGDRPRPARTPILGLVTSLCVVVASTTACKRDPALVEGEHVAADKAQLTEAVMRDVQLDGILRKADALAQTGDETKAATLVSNEAIPAADRAVATADALHPTSTWGSTRAKELTDLAHARRDSLPACVKALTSEDLQAKLDSTLVQVKLEEQALSVLAHVQDDADEPIAPPTLTPSAPDAHL